MSGYILGAGLQHFKPEEKYNLGQWKRREEGAGQEPVRAAATDSLDQY